MAEEKKNRSSRYVLSLLWIPLLAIAFSSWRLEWLVWPTWGKNVHKDDVLHITIRDSQISLIRRGDTQQRILKVIGDETRDVLRGLGYAHARDRLVQMVLLKSAAAGRLSELWIDTPKTRKIDMAMRESQYETISKKSIDMLDADSLAQLEWYAEGVNAFVEENPPLLDLQLAGFDPRRHPWSPIDTMMSLHVMSVLGLADLHLLVEKFLVQAIHSRQVRVDRLRTLFSPFLDALDEDLVQLLRQVHVGKSVLEDGIQFAGLFLPNKGGLGSNAWAVSGDHSASGKPILCADPHMDISRLPAIWYQVEWKSKTQHIFGITMPGLPFLVMGGNQNVSLGFTYGFGDYYDYYIEEVKDGHYRKDDDTWMPVEQTREIIHTKGGDEFEMVTFATSSGILDLDSMVVDSKHRMMERDNLVKHYLSDGFYLSRSNALTSEGLAAGMSAIRKIATSQTALEAAEHASRICIALNFVIADSDGNIVYQQSGTHPRRPESVSGLMPVQGWEAKNRWKGILQPHELVRIVNPSDGMIVSANNDVNDMLEKNNIPKNNHSSTGTRSSLNIHMGPYRRDRILALLKNKSSQKIMKHTMESMRSIQTDTAAPERLRNALMEIVESELQRHVNNNSRSARLLSEWDGRYSADSLGAVVFDRLYRSILDEIYGGIVFGRDVWAYVQSNTELFNVFSEIFDRPIFFEQSDDDPLEVFTSESKIEMMARVLVGVLEELDAEPTALSLGKIKELTMQNILYENQFPFPQLGYSYGPIPMNGGLGVVWQSGIQQQLGRAKRVSASWRFLSDLGNATIASSLPGGPSGNRLDGYLYVSGIKEHLEGIYTYFTLS